MLREPLEGLGFGNKNKSHTFSGMAPYGWSAEQDLNAATP